MLVTQLFDWYFFMHEHTAPGSAGHEDLFLLFLGEALRLTHEEVDEDNGDGGEASENEECARGRPCHQILSRETFDSLPEVEGENHSGKCAIGARFTGVDPGSGTSRCLVREDEGADQTDLQCVPAIKGDDGDQDQ